MKRFPKVGGLRFLFEEDRRLTVPPARLIESGLRGKLTTGIRMGVSDRGFVFCGITYGLVTKNSGDEKALVIVRHEKR